MSYCTYCKSEGARQVHIDYHNDVYGYPVEEDTMLFERLMLEINQAGLSWETILNKRKYFRFAFDGFNIEAVANYGEKDRERLLNDVTIIRNRLKIDAAIHNAREILQIQQEYGSFKEWLDVHHPLAKDEWVALFRRRFKFVGGEILNEFLMGIGYLKGAHDENCPIFDKILKLNPKWKEE